MEIPLWIKFGVIPLLVLYAVLWAIKRLSQPQSSSAASSRHAGVALQKDTVILIGPSGGGKTVLLHQLMAGRVPETVVSMKPGTLRGKLWRLRDEAGVPTIRLVDMPGHMQLRSGTLAAVPTAAAIVMVLDAAATDAGHLKAAANLLYDILTLPAYVEARPSPSPLLIALNKVDLPGAKTPEAVQRALEEELERLKVSRPSVATADADSGSVPLLLGTAEEPFSFERDCAAPLSWCSCVALGRCEEEDQAGAKGAGGGDTSDGAPVALVDDVQAFIAEAVVRR